ncbi:MAG: DUF6438 domain-containing protein, partial [Bacteroidota bacterium]
AFYPDAKNVDNYQLRAQYEQGVCFGRCPVFKVSLYQNGLVVYEGERFTDRLGTWQKVLPRAEATAIIDSFEQSKMQTYPLSFPSQIPDLSAKTLSFISVPSQKVYKTSWRENRPDELERLGAIMHRIAESGGYKQVADSIRRGPNILGQPTNLPPEELIVHLNPKVNPQAWIVKYSKQNAQLKEKVAPNGSYYVITADPNIMGADELLGYLRQDPDVLSAQRNRQVSPRGN